MNEDLGIIAPFGRKRYGGGSGACQGTPHEERKESSVAPTEGNEKPDKLAKEGAMLDKGFMADVRAKTMQQEREEVYAAFQCAASFHCSVEEWKDCDELKPKPKEKGIFVDQNY